MGETEKALRESLARKAKKGNNNALCDLCQLITKDVYYSALRILGNRADAEDATQETLIRLCSSIKGLNDPKAFGAWLGRITVNEARRIMKKNAMEKTVLNISDYQEVIEEDNREFLPQEFVIREDERNAVVGVVDRLPDRQREAVVLHYFNDLNVTETAEAMGVTQQVVSRYLKLAREKVKAEFSRQEYRSEARAYSLAALPAGSVLTMALKQDASYVAFTNEVWLRQTVGSVKEHIGNTAASTATKTLLWVLLGVGLTIITTVGVLVGIWLQNEPEEEAITVAFPTDYDVLFSGGNADATQINPRQAVAWVDTEYGEMEVQNWWITPETGEEMLYSGEGGIVDAALVEMIERAEAGEYLLNFSLVDAAGDPYTLTRQFSIRPDLGS